MGDLLSCKCRLEDNAVKDNATKNLTENVDFHETAIKYDPQKHDPHSPSHNQDKETPDNDPHSESPSSSIASSNQIDCLPNNVTDTNVPLLINMTKNMQMQMLNAHTKISTKTSTSTRTHTDINTHTCKHGNACVCACGCLATNAIKNKYTSVNANAKTKAKLDAKTNTTSNIVPNTNTNANKDMNTETEYEHQTLIFPPKRIGLVYSGNLVVSLLQGSSSEKQGVKKGWVITAVNGKLQPDITSEIYLAIAKTNDKRKKTTITFKRLKKQLEDPNLDAITHTKDKNQKNLILENQKNSILEAITKKNKQKRRPLPMIFLPPAKEWEAVKILTPSRKCPTTIGFAVCNLK